MLKKLKYLYSLGIKQVLTIFYYKITKTKITKDFDFSIFVGKLGLEIGGPSQFFDSNNLCPIYELCENLDNVNFSSKTKWEGSITTGETFKYCNTKKCGTQFLLESSELAGIPSLKYDFILSCHSLEHNANVIKTLREWYRVLKSDGYLLLVLPDKQYTFDKNREFTTFDHILEDERNNVPESDETHFNEVLERHYFIRDIAQESKKSFHNWVINNYQNRGVHHHVFNEKLVKEIANYLNLKLLFSGSYPPHHLVFLLKK
jgi:SAM-dependent methyltransferase